MTSPNHRPSEWDPLLRGQTNGPKQLQGSARRLYVSHFLSAWNSRAFEFGAVLYLATVFPGTLLPMSLYALARGLSAIVLAPTVGWCIDTGDRLRVVRASIVLQRLAVAASCGIFYALARGFPSDNAGRAGMLAVVSLFACVEKLSSMANFVSVEKDWVITVADDNVEALKAMNAKMRRIDLLCKLVAPLFIALLDGYSTQIAIIVNLGMNIASISIEYFAIARVYNDEPSLQKPKEPAHPRVGLEPVNDDTGMVRKFMRDFRLYIRHAAFLPSFAVAVLYLTVLSFSGQMVTYLLSTGYKSTQIGLARTLSVVFEVLATWVAPWLMGRIGALRAGLWMSSWQVLMLVAGITIFWKFEDRPFISASGLVGGTILSRIGLGGFDLCVQLIVQEEVEPENRGAFSAIEAAWQNAFELLSYATTIIFFRPEQFKWPSLISVAAVATASMAYTICVYLRRGHLLHLDILKI